MIPTVRRLLPVALVAISACSSGPSAEEAARTNKMADDLVKCRNESSSLKDQIADLKTELAKLKAASDPTKHLDAVDVEKPQQLHREGNLSPDAALKVLKTRAPTLRACYERGLKRNPNLQYTTSVNVRFAVRNTGNAYDISFSPKSDPDMEHCMAQAMSKWPFPQFQGDPVQFEAPVNLVAK